MIVQIMRLFLLFILSLVFTEGLSENQTFTIKGRVLDNRTLSPISYASIQVLELGHSTITDENGSFKLSNIRRGKIELSISVLG